MLQLPPRADGSSQVLDPRAGPVVIIGANGAGKSRFTDYILAQQPGAMRLSALDAVTATGPAGTEAPFDTLIHRLMHDELLSLIRYKAAQAAGEAPARLPRTRLDEVISLWKQVFPGNRILIESGEMLFARPADSDSEAYAPSKLSAGERTVLYYIASATYAPKGSLIFVDNSAMFLHPSVLATLWDLLEARRSDCTFIYTTHDLDFVATRQASTVVWVREYHPESVTWDYDLLPAGTGISDDIYLAILGARKHVLFIEGDGKNSIDARLYPLVFKDFTVKSLGSCNKVIEATRTFNDLRSFHHLDSRGIVDRDRRTPDEVRYLRERRVLVPEVAEIENLLLLEEVVRTVAEARGRSQDKVFAHVRKSILSQFSHDLRQQALLHTRHRVKRTMEYRIDGRFSNIGEFEDHIGELFSEINARGLYEEFCRSFRRMLADGDYAGVLRVYNQKSMLPGCNVAGLVGLRNKEEYIREVIRLLREDGPRAARIRRAVFACFNISIDENDHPAGPAPADAPDTAPGPGGRH